MSEYAFELKNIEKSFGGVKVIKKVNLSIKPGEILALLGENGAGKTTLMNIQGGILKADEGNIYINGHEIVINNPIEARKHGIAFVHQELNVVNDLRVYENLFLGSELKKGFFLNRSVMIEKTREILKRLEVDVDPTILVSSLDASYKQIVEIASALLQNAKLLILDEPTTSLTNIEIENLFRLMRSLKNDKVSMVFISHKLGEVLQIADNYMVMRDGAVVINEPIKKDGENRTTTTKLAQYMVGKTVFQGSIGNTMAKDNVIMELKNFSDNKNFFNINLSLKEGEILGITGLLGDGRSEMAQCIFGARETYTGEIYIEGNKVKIQNESQAKKLGIGYVPRNRKENAIIPLMSIKNNFSLVTIMEKFSKFGIIHTKKETVSCREKILYFNIKASDINNLITTLSGGNQQKLVLAKWMEANLKILIFDNPTQGVDVGAKTEIYQIIQKLAEDGMAIMILSSEPQEIIRICNRAYVLYHGRINGKLEREEMSEEKIMLMMASTSNESED